MTPAPASFRARFLAGDLLLGAFIKTPTPHATEILGGVGFDFVVIDEEHAPFDRVTIDTVLLAARASQTAGLVRVAEPTPARLLAALDDGAAGVLAPHVASVEKAKDVVAACRYRGGKRGFSNSPRAGGYGKLGVWDHVDAADASVAVIAMIEDPEALDAIDAIVAVEGLDGVFIGRGDLTVAMGATGPADPRVRAAAQTITAAARTAGKPVCIMVADAKEAQDWRALGASAFIVGSDQGFLRQSALRTRTEFSALPAR
ncbi:2-keto-3-deoxy-L-rhamnonate aldolase RhmA [Roseiarcus fermentans]|uniref:2-keto-3-deoxy-L-rhamnonate aldolase RhmA n=1 Tax=Roseiarcus fermentans TaxID=1473586 RepID=A0A366FUB2_9HYPH|nr:aldolase/citrate lyase family protein [Roseiarcus fermentans]RBP18111.1 2-keto-3-deoxy-L-rhamnonate aldolase RhmA [Roseiarcus fermentans]